MTVVCGGLNHHRVTETQNREKDSLWLCVSVVKDFYEQR
jgi:hypothetical protein